jgi:D-alanyl-D-alanine carboxypeptidase/D-alanyl-D-alanine-endopeptidase (penicillin-binding protein 4)
MRSALWGIAGALALAGCVRSAPQAGSPPLRASAPPHATASPAPIEAPERARIRGELERTFSAPAFDGAGLVVLAADGTPLVERRADARMTPASALKLLVAATALRVFGPSRRFDTTFEALDVPDRDGTLRGPLWLVGGGDPLLRSDDLRGGVAVLARSGVRRIEGGLMVDTSAFAGPEQNPFWDPADLSYDYAAGTSAISLDGNVAEFRVTPGAPGDPAHVDVQPPNADVTFTGSIATVGYDDSDVHIDRVETGRSVAQNQFALSGHIAAGSEQSYFLPVVGLAPYVGGAVQAMLVQRGITLTGGVQAGVAPFAGRTLWTHRSEPLAALLREMLVFSDNHTAEQLLRIVGYEEARSGTERGGISVERTFLRSNGIAPDGLHVVDGSGLSPQDRIAPIVLARVLGAGLEGPDGPTFLRALPLVGREGTLKRHVLHAALGRARAKSGHISGVAALVGTVQTRRRGRVTFAFVVNGPYADAAAVDEATDRALDMLALL